MPADLVEFIPDHVFLFPDLVAPTADHVFFVRDRVFFPADRVETTPESVEITRDLVEMPPNRVAISQDSVESTPMIVEPPPVPIQSTRALIFTRYSTIRESTGLEAFPEFLFPCLQSGLSRLAEHRYPLPLRGTAARTQSLRFARVLATVGAGSGESVCS